MQRINNIFSYIKSKKISVLESFGQNICFIPVKISVFGETKSLSKKINRARDILKEKGVSDILLTNELKNLINKKDLCGIPKSNLIDVFQILYKKLSVKQCKIIDVYDKELSFFNYSIAEKIIFSGDKLVVYTDNISLAKKIAEKIYYEYGVWIDTKQYLFNYKRNGFVIDADRGIVRIGDTFADGIIYDIDLGQYDINIRDIADNIDVSGYIDIKSLISGKNLINLVDN